LLSKLIGTVFFIGYFPFAPGTAGSLLCCILLYFVPEINPMYKIIILLFIFIMGVKVSSDLKKEWGNDPSRVVIDEICGMYCTLIFIPKSIKFYLVGFLIFRFFDIIKPFPVRRSEKLKDGWGIMTDDLVAGIYSAILVWVVVEIFRR